MTDQDQIQNAAAGIKAISEVLINERIFVQGEVNEYIPLEAPIVGVLHNTLDLLADVIINLSK